MTATAVRPEAPADGVEDGAGASHGVERVRVPWLTVVPLAAVLAYGDGFWVVALRGALGAIERTSAPFTSWMRESTLLLPLFAVAVVAALALAVRRFGAAASGTRAVVGTAALVALIGTVVGVAWLVASAAYDYSLQTAQVDAMGTMGHSCDAACRDLLNSAGRGLQVKGVAIGVGLMLVTNVLLVTWMVSLLGGRLRLATVTEVPRRTHRAPTRGATGTDWQLLQATALLGAGAVHAAVAPEHLTEWPAAGSFFLALTLAEVVLAVSLLASRGGRTTQLAVAVISVGPLLLWTWSRTSGLPFGPQAGVPEPVGLADLAAGALELVALAVAVSLLSARGRSGRQGQAHRLPAHQRAALLLTVAGVTCLGLGGSALPGVHEFGVDSAMTSAGP